MRRRVVITGLGAVSGLGVGFDAFWDGLVAGKSSIGPIEAFDAGGFPCRLAGEATGFRARDHVPKSYRKATKVMARDIELAVGAADTAVRDAGVITRGLDAGEPTYPGSRMGCNIGAGLIATETDELTMALATSTVGDGVFDLGRWGESGMTNLQPLWMLKYLPNMLACHVTIIHGAEGPSNTVTCAEASGLLSIGESARVIERGSADVCLAGGAESKVNPLGMVRIGLAGRLATTGDETDGSAMLRPFDADSPGSVLGEGGGILVLEESQAAADRGARVYAEISGFGAAQSSPPYAGLSIGDATERPAFEDGLVAAISRALGDAGIDAAQIDAIVPHGSGSAPVDSLEAGALRETFGDRLGSIPLVTWTPNIGDCFAGNGGLQVGLAARCLHEQKLPARIHSGRAGDGLDAGPADARDAALRHVLVCSSALGGQNAALVVSAAQIYVFNFVPETKPMSDEYRGGGRGRRGTPLSDLDPALTEISRRVIGCAIEVHKGLGPGYDRGVYITALRHELDSDDISYVLDAKFDVEYGDKKVGEACCDMHVGDRFLLMLLARPGEIGSYERSMLRAQLRAADLELGLVINFAERRLKDGLVRVLNPDKLNAMRGDDDHHHDDDHGEDHED